MNNRSPCNPPSVTTDPSVEQAAFRGNLLRGKTLPLPQGTRGLVAQPKDGWQPTAEFSQLTYWNHERVPSHTDAAQRVLEWMSVAAMVRCTTALIPLHLFILMLYIHTDAPTRATGQCARCHAQHHHPYTTIVVALPHLKNHHFCIHHQHTCNSLIIPATLSPTPTSPTTAATPPSTPPTPSAIVPTVAPLCLLLAKHVFQL